MMKIETLRFGELEINPETTLHMPEGLVGMNAAKDFCLIEENPESSVKWLQVIGEPALAFVVVNPYDFYSDYEFEVDDEDAELLEVESPEDVAVLTILTIPPGGIEVTANLVAPVVVNTRTRKAKQVIIQDDRYTTKHPLCQDSMLEAANA